jgi:hypothetical protein
MIRWRSRSAVIGPNNLSRLMLFERLRSAAGRLLAQLSNTSAPDTALPATSTSQSSGSSPRSRLSCDRRAMLTCPPYRNRWRPLRSLLGTLLNSSRADSPTRFRGRRETALRCHEFFGTLRAVGIDVDGGRPERFLLSPPTDHDKQKHCQGLDNRPLASATGASTLRPEGFTTRPPYIGFASPSCTRGEN